MTPRHNPEVGLFAFLKIRSNLHLQLEIELDRLTDRSTRQLQDGLTQVCRCAFDSTALVNQPLDFHIELEAAITIRTIRKMLLYYSDLFGTKLPVNIKMETRDALNTTHNYFLIFPEPARFENFYVGSSCN